MSEARYAWQSCCAAEAITNMVTPTRVRGVGGFKVRWDGWYGSIINVAASNWSVNAGIP